MSSKKDIDEAYERLKQIGENTVANLVQWMKDSKILQMVDKSEKEATEMFKEVHAQQKVTKEQFDDVIAQLLKDNEQTIAEVTKNLNEVASKVIQALQSAATEFQRAMEDPKPSKK